MNTLNPADGAAHDLHHHHPSFIKKYIFSTDHKMIGIQFLITTLIMLLLGGSLALGVRWQLAWPWQNMPIFGGQWVTGEKWPYDLKIVDNSVNQLFEPEQKIVPIAW